MMREISRGNFSSGGFSRYYCAECAEEAERAVRRFEQEVDK